MTKYLICSTLLLIVGGFGLFFFHRHILLVLISFELIILAVDLNFACFSTYFDDLLGQLYILLILTIAAAESALGLAIIIVYYRLRGGLSLEFIKLLKK